MRYLLSGFLLLMAVFSTRAQVAEGWDEQINLNDIGRDGNMGVVRTYDNRYEGVKGSPFFLDQWIKGTVYLENGKIFKDIPIKYDVYQNEVLVRTKGQSIYITRESINSFELKPDSLNHEIKFTKVKPDNELAKIGADQFFRILYEDDITLLEVQDKIFLKANYQGAYSANRPYDEFKSTSKYFFLDNQNRLHKLKTSIGGVAKIFGGNKKKVKDYIFENKLDPKNTNDLVMIFKKGSSFK